MKITQREALQEARCARYRVYFQINPGAKMNHNSTWAEDGDAQRRSRFLQDKGYGTEIVDLKSTVQPLMTEQEYEVAVQETANAQTKAENRWEKNSINVSCFVLPEACIISTFERGGGRLSNFKEIGKGTSWEAAFADADRKENGPAA